MGEDRFFSFDYTAPDWFGLKVGRLAGYGVLLQAHRRFNNSDTASQGFGVGQVGSQLDRVLGLGLWEAEHNGFHGRWTSPSSHAFCVGTDEDGAYVSIGFRQINIAKAKREARRTLRNAGLSRFGFATEDFRHHHQLLRVWGPLQPPRWEVWRWPVGTGSSDVDCAYKAAVAKHGTEAAYEVIRRHAELRYVGRSWEDAKASIAFEPRPSEAWRSPLFCDHARGVFRAATGVVPIVREGGAVNANVGVVFICRDCGFARAGDVTAGLASALRPSVVMTS